MIKNKNTVQDWIEFAADVFETEGVFFGHGTDNAWDEAVQLVLQVLKLPITAGKEVLTRAVTFSEQEALNQLIQARITTRKPLPYLTHCAWFMRSPFYVNEKVLIPRSPFGEWIERQFIPWVNPKKINRILDIGTGSGCLAIGCALRFPQAQVDAVDINEEALAVARINIAHYQVESRVHLMQSDVFSHLKNKQYDLIISNPPYVSQEEMDELPPEYTHEPRLALEASEDGLAVVKKILHQAHQHLEPKGILIVEVGNTQENLEKAYPHIAFTWLELEHGGEGLFLFTKEQLEEFK